jgi:S-formylglutathione hydrolase FrmB
MALSTALGTVLISVATVVFWNRAELPRAGRWAIRLVLLSAGQLSAVLVVAVLLNNTFVFYQSWSELLGQHPRQEQSAAELGSFDARLRPELYRDFLAERGTLTSLPVAGLASGVHAGPATVYLPPQYGDPAYADRSFPVVELLSGFPGGPHPWVRMLHVVDVLDSLIATGRAVPFIAVMPEQNVAWPRDTECVNVVGGPQVDSYLSDDVRTAVVRAFRASAGSRWAVMGDSTGGYCASSLAFRHPGMYAAAVSLAGYNAPAHDATTGNLFQGDPRRADDFSPLWLLQHGRAPDVALLLISTHADRASYRAAERMAEASRPPLRLSLLTLPRGGHNFATFAAEIPVGFSWLSRYVATALAPLPKVDGLLPTPVGVPVKSVPRSMTCVGGSVPPRQCPTVSTAGSGHRNR